MAYKISGGDSQESKYVQTWQSLGDTVEIHWNLHSVTCKKYVGSPEAGIEIPTTPGNVIDFDAGYRDMTIYFKWNDEDYIMSMDWEGDPAYRDEIDSTHEDTGLGDIIAQVCLRKPGGVDSFMKTNGWREVSKQFHFGGSEIEVEEVGGVNEELERIVALSKHLR